MAEAPQKQQNGRLRRFRTRLARAAEQEPTSQEPSNRGFAILLACILAFLLWLTVSLGQDYTVNFHMPVQVRNIPEGQALERQLPARVIAQIEGEGWLLMRLYTDPEPIIVDASLPTVNFTDLVIQEVSRDLRVNTVAPNELPLPLGTKISRALPIRLRGRITPAPTYDTVQTPWITPDTVTISGAEALVNRLQFWPTQPVLHEGVRESFTTEIPLVDSLSNLIELDRTTTTLHVEVEQYTELTRGVEVYVAGKPSDDKQVSLLPDQIEVAFLVPLSQYDRAEQDDSLYAYVPYEDLYLDDSTGTATPMMHVPSDLRLRDVQMLTNRLEYYLVLE